MTVTIRRLTDDTVTDAERERVKRVLVDAFLGYQPHVDLWTDNVHLNDTLFGTMADVGLREHETWVAEREGTIAGVAVWAAPGKQFVEDSQVDVVFGPVLDLATPERRKILAEVIEGMSVMMNSVAPDSERRYWFLANLAVAPEYQGQGIGGQLLEFHKARANGTPMSLSTQTESNIRFYGKHGFVVRATKAYPLPDDKSWVDRYLTIPEDAA